MGWNLIPKQTSFAGKKVNKDGTFKLDWSCLLTDHKRLMHSAPECWVWLEYS